MGQMTAGMALIEDTENAGDIVKEPWTASSIAWGLIVPVIDVAILYLIYLLVR